MKKATIVINLYEYKELRRESKMVAVNNHYDFLHSQGVEVENEEGELVIEEYKPTELEVVESIEINEYFFYENGELANVTHYVGKHKLSGSTVYKHKNGTEVFI